MTNNYDDLDFCINLINEYLESNDKSKYRVEPISLSELTPEKIIKDSDFKYKNIIKDTKFKFESNGKKVNHGKDYEISIKPYDGNQNNILDEENRGLIFNYYLSELVTLHNLDIVLLNLMNFIDEDNNLVSVYNGTSHTLKEFFNNNDFDLEIVKNIFFQILYNLHKINIKVKNFRHNNLNLESVRIIKNTNSNKKILFDLGLDNKVIKDCEYIVKFTDFDNSSCDIISKNLNLKKPSENPYYDIHSFFSSYMHYALYENEKYNDEHVENFINNIISEDYRYYNNKKSNIYLDEKVFENNETKFILPIDILEKNNFFANSISRMQKNKSNKNSIKNNEAELSVSSISISENSLSKYNKKNSKINYNIENSLTETSGDKSRMFAKNIKYKNKKTSSNINNINSMIKGTRRLYVPNRNNLTEGSMTSDVLSNVENDKRKERDDDKKRRTRKIEDESESVDKEPEEISDESSVENEDLSAEPKVSRSKSKKDSKKSSKKSKKMMSESSLPSLSSSGVNTEHQKTMTGTEVRNIMGQYSESALKKNVLGNLPENYSGPIPHGMMQQGLSQQKQTNRLGALLGTDGQAPNGAAPPNLQPMSVGMMENGLNATMSPQMMMSPVAPSMPNMPGMSMLGNVQQMGQMTQMMGAMPQMMGQMPQMGNMMGNLGMPSLPPQVQSVTLGGPQEGSLAPQVPEPVAQPSNNMNLAQALNQQGGSKPDTRRVLRLKKDFFF